MPMDKETLTEAFNSNTRIDHLAKRLGIGYEKLKKLFINEFGNRAYEERKTRLKKASTSGDNNYQVRQKKEGIKHWNTKNPEDKIPQITAQGYRMIGTPEWFEGMSHQGFSLEHQIVYCQYNDLTKIPKGYIIHHKDEDKLNNDPANLELLSRAEHAILHKPRKSR